VNTNLKKLAVEVHQTAIDLEWWWKYDYWKEKMSRYGGALTPEDPCPDILAAKLALIHSEISEAYNEWSYGHYSLYYKPDNPDKPEGVIVELADVLFRALDLRERLGMKIGTPVDVLLEYGGSSPDTLCMAHNMVSDTVEHLRRNDMHGVETQLALFTEMICFYAYHIMNKSWEPFEEAIQKKMAYNKTREIRHGGKAL